MTENNVQRAGHPGPIPPQDFTLLVTDHPAPQETLRRVLGEIDGPRFRPAVGFGERTALARRHGLDREDAERLALAGLARDEALLRAHGVSWRVVEVTARVGCGEGVVGPVLSHDAAALEAARTLAVTLAREDALDWARLGLN